MSDALLQPLAVILFLGVLVLFHEAGHFLVGKILGLPAEIFSIGFGPVIMRWRRQETDYRLSIIPLGGFVKFYGSTVQDEVPADYKGSLYHEAPVWKRALTVAAGPGFNFILAVMVFAYLGFRGIAWPPAVVGEVMDQSPAQLAGLEFGDKVIAINGNPIKTWRDLQKQIGGTIDAPLRFDIERESKRLSLDIRPRGVNDEEAPVQRQKGQIGISPVGVNAVLVPNYAHKSLVSQGVDGPIKVNGLLFQGQTRPVKFYGDLLLGLRALKDSGMDQFQLILEQGESFSGPSVLNLELNDELRARDPEDILANLGLLSADLVVKTVLKEAEGILKPGDRLLSFNHTNLKSSSNLRQLSMEYTKPTAQISFLRNAEVIDAELPLHPEDIQKPEGKQTIYLPPLDFLAQNVVPDSVFERYDNPILALEYGVRETYRHAKTITEALIGLVTGKVPLKALGGPIAIAKVASDSVKLGIEAFLNTLALISVNLGLLNLFPIPVLDGGQLVLLSLESLNRKPLGIKIVENYQKLGFVLVLSLVVLATYNDLARFWSGLISSWTVGQ